MVSGGITSTREDGIEDVCEYNPDFDRWIARAPMHQQRDSHTMIAHGKLVFVVGGQEKERAGVEVNSYFFLFSMFFHNINHKNFLSIH
jgi:hypothetical protein